MLSTYFKGTGPGDTEVSTSNPLPVQASPSTAAKASSATSTVVTSDGTALAASATRKAWSIQNLDDAAVYVKLGASATSSDFSFVLKAGTAANDGLGGVMV